MTKKLAMIGMIFAAAIILMLGSVVAQEAAKDTTKAEKQTFQYIGDKKCRVCHKIEHTSWLETVHAKAWDRLKPEEQKNPECVACHSTGKTAEGELLTGVQCESCHGPGSAYRTKKIMEDKKLSLANGLIEPTKEVCITCHNEKSPTFKGFDFDKAVKDTKAMHSITPKEEKKEG